MEVLYQSHILHNSPRIEVIDNFLNVSLCSHVINEASDSLYTVNLINDGDSRVSETFYIIKHNASQKIMNIVNSLSQLINIPATHAENAKVLHYKTGECSLPHQDAFTSETDLEWTKMKPSNGGQRIIACFVFLNTVQQGGELFFPKIDLRIEAQQGRAVIFDTVFAGTNKPHSLSENSILPVIDGEKWCFKIWFREKNIVP